MTRSRRGWRSPASRWWSPAGSAESPLPDRPRRRPSRAGPPRCARPLRAALGRRDLPACAALVDEHDGGRSSSWRSRFSAKLSRALGKNCAPGMECGFSSDRTFAPNGPDVGEPRELRPEFFRLRHGPGVQVREAAELQALAGVQAGSESCQVGVGYTGRGGAPELAHVYNDW